MQRVSLVLALCAVAAALAALPAAAKEGVEATLVSHVPIRASAGTRLRIAWKLVDEHGRPFGANGVFVRLLSPTGAQAQTAFAPAAAHATGAYAATVVVPRGGIRDIQIGLRGWTNGPGGTHRADVLFPISNDPFER